MRERISNPFERFVRWLRPESSPFEAFRLRFMVASCLVGLLVAIPATIAAFSDGEWVGAAMTALFGLSMIGALALLRTRLGISAAAWANVGMVAIFFFAVTLVNDEMSWKQLYWFALLPMAAMLSIGERAAAKAAVAAVALGAASYGFHRLGWTLHRPLLESPENAFIDFVLFVASVVSLTALFELLRKRAMAEAERASSARAHFLANVSHEIRTPMSGVIGMAELLATTPLDDEQKEFVEVIRRSGVSLVTIINDILDFTKLESGKVELEDVAVNVRELVGDTVALSAVVAQKKGLSVVTHVDDGVPRLVRGDPTRLAQVLRNLVSNAVKFTEEGEVRLEAKVAGARLVFAVIDQGVGLSTASIGTLFQPFVQADASTTRRFGGTGLGLAISRQLCALMGGSLEVSSVVGQGSTFTASLPLVPDRSGELLAESKVRADAL